MKWGRAGWRPIVRVVVLVGLLAGLVGGCYQEPVAITTWPPTDGPAPTDTAPTPPPTTASPADCVDGWTSPAAGSVHYDAAVAVLNRQLEVDGAWQIDALRYFTGPDVSWSDAPAAMVERWYVRGALGADANVRGRFLIERRTDGVALVAAVAPYDSHGLQSPDWMAFFGDGQPTAYPGLPGQWSGRPHDFVSGDGYAGQPGLPDQVIGCLSDT